MTKRVFLANPDLSKLEVDNVNDALLSTWISSSGRYVDRAEAGIADLAGVTNALVVSNGTVAIHLALIGLGAGIGDEIIVPSLTYIAPVNAVTYVGASPVFVDVDPVTGCLDPAEVSLAVTSKTVGIIAVDLYGHPADYDALHEICARHSLWLLEDAAEAPTATYRGRPAGSFGDVGTFSFYGNKIFTSGEGGAVVTSDDALHERMKLIRGQGMDPQRRYFFPVIGHNFRMTNLSAAILVGQLDRRTELLGKREAVYRKYQESLESVPGIQSLGQADSVRTAPWLYSILVDAEYGLNRDELAAGLESEGIETRPFFIPVHTLPPYRHIPAENLVHTQSLASRGLNLPTHTALSVEEVERVIDAIRAMAR